MKHGSLFSGIGGFDLAAEWMGWKNVFHCEIDPFCQKILKRHFPKSISYGDITKTDFTIHRGGIDILTGGFPCQPFSMAGKRKGTSDERHLWPQMLRAIREIKPGWVVGENVSGIISWNGGMVFEQVQADMETEGYEVWPYVLPAASVGAPHRRDRVWIVAYSDRYGRSRIENEKYSTERRQPSQCRVRQRNGDGSASNANSGRLPGQKHGQTQSRRISETNFSSYWQNFPTQSPVCDGDDGISADLVRYILRTGGDCYTEEKAEKEAKRIISKVRAEGIKAGGNAIVHQVALQIFKAIEQFRNC